MATLRSFQSIPRITRLARQPQLVKPLIPFSQFHSSRRQNVAVGDRIPDLEVLSEDSPGNKVNLGKETANGKALIIGVPAAFSPSCSNSHVPGYISHPSLRSHGKVFVVSVNDAFVMKAWATTLDPSGSSGIRFLSDATGKFTSALDVAFDGGAVFGHPRSKRYAIAVEDGKVKRVSIEPDNTGVDVSSADKFLA